MQMHTHIYSLKLSPGFVLLAKFCPWLNVRMMYVIMPSVMLGVMMHSVIVLNVTAPSSNPLLSFLETFFFQLGVAFSEWLHPAKQKAQLMLLDLKRPSLLEEINAS